MTIKRRIKQIIEKVTDTHIYRTKQLPRGIDFAHDIKQHLPMIQMNLVFDVGASTGQSTINFLSLFPKANIYCFEPVNDTFRQLQLALKDHDRVHSFQLALGASQGEGSMVHEGSPDMFYLTPSAKLSEGTHQSSEKVDVDTIDAFCCKENIQHITYLKIDTEGGDLDVLRGSEKMLREHHIDLVEVEAGMNCRNEMHVSFEELKAFLEYNNYFLFAIYEQIGEWPTKEPNLRRSNAVFVSEPVIKANCY